MHTARPLDHAAIVADFHRDGFALVRDAIAPEAIARLRELGDAVFADPAAMAAARHGFPFVAARLYELHPEFAAFAASEPLFALMRAVLGDGFQACGMTLIRNPPGQAIDRFHVDDVVECPAPAGADDHDPRLVMPVLWLTVQMPLTDIDAVEHGPTEFVPGSHRSGRAPDDPYAPTYAGRGPVPVLCRAGDLYLQNNQCWHRGAPNTSTRTRRLLQVQYARRWCAARFHPPLRRHARERVLAGADARVRQVLGEADVYEVAGDPYARAEAGEASAPRKQAAENQQPACPHAHFAGRGRADFPRNGHAPACFTGGLRPPEPPAGRFSEPC